MSMRVGFVGANYTDILYTPSSEAESPDQIISLLVPLWLFYACYHGAAAIFLLLAFQQRHRILAHSYQFFGYLGAVAMTTANVFSLPSVLSRDFVLACPAACGIPFCCQGSGTAGIATSDAFSMVPGTGCLNWWGSLALHENTRCRKAAGKAVAASTGQVCFVEIWQTRNLCQGDGCESITNEEACLSSRDGSEIAMTQLAFQPPFSLSVEKRKIKKVWLAPPFR